MQPKAEYFDNLVDKGLLTNFRDTAKEIGLKQNQFIKILIAKKYIYRDKQNHIKPYSQYNDDLFKMKDWGNDKASQEIVGLSAQITTMKPKTTYFDVMMKNKSTSVITSMAQDYGMSPQAFNKLLHEHGIQHKVSDQWVLYRQYLDKGYVNSEPVTITHNDGKQTIKYNTKWTQKGRFFLYEFLKEKGILPLIERNNNGETH